MTSRRRSSAPSAPLTGTGTARLATRAGWFILVLAILELAWLGWFLVEPLPNVPRNRARSGAAARAKAFPEVVPDTTFRESLLGQALWS